MPRGADPAPRRDPDVLPETLPGVDLATSRFVEAADHTGTRRRWHLFDTAPLLAERGIEPVGTLLCVHGNPTWGYLFRHLLSADPAQLPWRVVAVDQLEMGFSERTGIDRRLQDRITDLSLLTDELGLSGRTVTVGHDWGGLVSIGWALNNRTELDGMILYNTAIHHLDQAIPPALTLAGSSGVLPMATSTTTAFLDTTLNLANPPLAPEVKDAYHAPYRTRERRAGIEQFVADIPVPASHPSAPVLERLAEGLRDLRVPVLLPWGPRDIIFGDRYLDDLVDRLPQADVHRWETASHLVTEDADTAPVVATWLNDRFGEPRRDLDPVSAHAEQPEYRPMLAELERLAADPQHRDGRAVIELRPADGGGPRAISWQLLGRNVARIAAGLRARGLRPGDRVSILVPPGADLTAALYGVLRAGGVAVVADAGLGIQGLTRATVGSRPRFLIGIEKALVGARAYGWPGEPISVTDLPTLDRRALGVRASLQSLARDGAKALRRAPDLLGDQPAADSDAAILFTSGSTGPAKGAVYTHRQLSAMIRAVAGNIPMGPDSGLVAGFAPFALLGPALGTPSAAPDMDVSAPATLTAAKLGDAVALLDAPAVFTAPAALDNIVRTAPDASADQRAALASVPLFLSAGAPIPADRLEALGEVMPAAHALTPYGMTECLVATVADLETIRAAGAGDGVCVGAPAPGVEIALAPLDDLGAPIDEPTSEPGVVGEVLIRAAHVRDRYDRRWFQTRQASRLPGWHFSGDIGALDDAGRLWIQGRLSHAISTPAGVVTPVGVENAAQSVPAVRRAGAAGIGPVGTQQLVVVVEREGEYATPGARARGPYLAPADLAAEIRAAVTPPVAAILVVPELPTDIRHNSKVDRSRLGDWAAGVLGGGRMVAP